MRARLAEEIVEVEGDARQIAEVLQQGEERKENRHWRQHDRNDPGQGPVDPFYQQTCHPFGGGNPAEEFQQEALHPEQSVGDQGGRHVGARNRDPEDAEQHQDHDGDAGRFRGQNMIDFAVPLGVLLLFIDDGFAAERFTKLHDPGYDLIPEGIVCNSRLLQEFLCFLHPARNRFIRQNVGPEVIPHGAQQAFVSIQQLNRCPAAVQPSV